MERVGQVFIWPALILDSILCNFVCVHTDHGDLYRPSKVVVVVAQMISWSLDLILRETGCVVNRLIEYWLHSSSSNYMGNENKVKNRVSLRLNDGSINDCSTTWVQDVLSLFREKTMVAVSFNQAIDNLGIVARNYVLEVVRDCLDFSFLNQLSKTRPSHSISINYYLFRKMSIVFVPIS